MDLLTMRENSDNFEFSHEELNDMLQYVWQNDFYRHLTPE